MSQQAKIIGIDFGTTNSVAAIFEGTEPVVIPTQEGALKTPSIVGFLDNNEVVVGEKARRQAVTNPRRTVSSVKRLLGRSIEDIDDSGDIFPYEIVDQDGNLMIDVDGMGYRPEQIGALILAKIREDACAFIGEDIRQAVITVPAYFDDLQRQAVKEAAAMAGLEVLRLINEPTAAAMAYGLGRVSDKEEIIAIYDFGGGTFDITILEITGKTFEVLCSTGDSHLGGDDLDNMIVQRIVEEIYEDHGIDLSQDPSGLRRLKEAAEKAKCELSTATAARVALPFFAYKDGQPVHLDRELTRDELEEMIEPLVNRTIKCCRRALEDAALNKRDINKVILVGGSTRVPLVQDAIEDFFGIAPFKGVNPDEVVSLGAATQAGVFEGNITEVTLLDVTPHSLGIEVKDGRFSKIIEKNSTIPIKAAKAFTTTEDNQEFVNIHILQGESDEAAENRSLGKFILSGIQSASAGVPRIRVTFFINADGVMEIGAGDMSTGSEQKLTVLHSQLTDAERTSRKKRKVRSQRATSKGGAKAKARAAGGPADTGAPTGVPIAGGARRKSPEDSGAEAMPPRPADGTPQPSGAAFAMLRDSQSDAPPPPPPVAEANRAMAAKATPPGNLPPAAGHNFGAMPQMYTATPSAGMPANAKPYMPPSSGEINPSGISPRMMTPVPLKDGPPPPVKRDSTEAMMPPPPPFTTHGDTMKMAPMKEAPEQIAGSAAATQPSADPALFAEQNMPEIVETALDLVEGSLDDPQSQRSFAEALKALSQPPFEDSLSFSVLASRARLEIALGQPEESRRTLAQIRDHHGRAETTAARSLHDFALERFAMAAPQRRDRALLLEVLGDYNAAAEDLEQAMRQEAADGDVESIVRIYKARIAESTDPGMMFKLVKVYLKQNRTEEAIAILNDLQRYENYRTRAVKILGLCHWQQNLHTLAWQKFRQLDPTDDIKDILYRLAADMERTDNLKNAKEVYEFLMTLDENFRDTPAKLKKLQFRLKLQAEEAEESGVQDAVIKDSRFTIIEEINRGSMGIIYKAKDKTLDEIVALKVLNDFLCQDPMAVERFKREARAAKKLSHPYIVRIHDMFETGNKRFISMEYIEGTDLKRLISERTHVTEEMLLYYLMQICDAMAYAHKLGIVHRDIKPANIMITKSNVVKITDFGIAKILRGDDGTKSGTAVIGTPLYMAPEQITGAGVDERSDIYAIGILMYEMVSGNPPFYLGNIEYHHIHTVPPALPEKVSPGLQEIILKCIRKDPADRFQTVDGILEELKKLRGN